MTDQLEHDLRALLAERASAVTADVAHGETAIGDRLRAGDAGLADVVAVAGRSRRVWGLAAVAAAVVVAVVGATVALQDRDAAVVTSSPDPTNAPTGFFTGEGTAAEVASSYLVDRLGVDAADLVLDQVPPEAEDPVDLVGVSWELASWNTRDARARTVVLRDLGGDRWEVVESYSDGASIDSMEISGDHVLVHATGPSTLNLSAHAIDGTDSGTASSSFCAVGTAIEGGVLETTTTTIEPPITDCEAELEVDLDLLPATVRLIVTDADDSPVMLEERLIDDAVEGTSSGVDSATTVTADGPPAGGPTVGEPFDAAKDVAERVAREVFGEDYVTMAATDEGSVTLVTLEGEGGELVAEVAYDDQLDRERLLRIRPAAGPDWIGVIDQNGTLGFELPEGGSFSYAVLDEGLTELQADSIVALGSEVSVGPIGPLDDDATWIWARLETPDGRVLHWFDTR